MQKTKKSLYTSKRNYCWVCLNGTDGTAAGYGVAGALELSGSGAIWNEPGGWSTPTRLPTRRTRGGATGGMSGAFKDFDSPARVHDRKKKGSRRGSV